MLTRQNGGHAVLCKDCKADRKKARQKEHDHNRRALYKMREKEFMVADGGCCVIYDPDPIGGFGRNALLDRVNYQSTLMMNNFTLGTILQFKDGRRMEVIDGVPHYRVVEV